MKYADATKLRERNRHVGFGHRVHRRGQNRNVERNLASELGLGLGLARKDAQFERLQEDVVERQAEGNVRSAVEVGHIGP